MRKLLCIFFVLFAFDSLAAEKKAILKEGVSKPYKAPEFDGIQRWYNSSNYRMSELHGKIVLVNFWLYSCEKCLAALQHLGELNYKYASKGLVIIGVHSPEFDFEVNTPSLENAIHKYDIKYSVAADNNRVTAQNFKNRSLPSYYLINQSGNVVYVQQQGEYDLLENNIRALLMLDEIGNAKVPTEAEPEDFDITTPATFLGIDRRERNANPSLQRQEFPRKLLAHYWALQGSWKSNQQFIESTRAGDAIRINFRAKRITLVMSSASGNPVNAMVFLNGKPMPTDGSGFDVKNGNANVWKSQPYELANFSKINEGTLEIRATSEGLRLHAFKFEE